MFFRIFTQVVATLLLTVWAGVFTGCTPKSDPPKFNSPLTDEAMAACKDAGLNFQNFEPKKIRTLISCLNGSRQSLQPYQDLVDGLNDEELQTLLTIYNKHIVAKQDNRLNKTIDLVDRLRTQGNLQVLLKNLAVLVESRVPQTFIPIMATAFEEDGLDVEHRRSLYRFVGRMIDLDLMSPGIIASSNAFSGARAQVLAYLLSSTAFKKSLGLDQAVDLFSDILLDAIDDGSMHSFWVHLADSQVSATLRTISDRETLGVADILNYFSDSSPQGRDRFEKLRKLQVAADRPLTCFQSNERNSYRQADSLLHFIALESSKRQSKEAIDRFYLQAVPVMLAATKPVCAYPQEAINNLDLLYDAVRLGYGEGVHGLMSLLARGARFDEIVSVTKSKHLEKAVPLLEEFKNTGGLVFLIQLLSRDLTEKDVRSLGMILDHMTSPASGAGAAMRQWLLKQVIKDENAKKLLHATLESFTGSTADFSIYLSQRPDLDNAYREFKRIVARSFDEAGPEAALNVMLKKVLRKDPAARKQVVDAAQSILNSWGKFEGGMGQVLSVWATATELSEERPIQQIIRDVLNDDELTSRMTPLLLKIARDPKLMRAVDFTGEIARNGDLEKLLRFFIDLFKSSNGSGLSGSQAISQRTAVKNVNVNELLELNKPGQTISSPKDLGSSDCTGLRGHLFDEEGKNLEKAVRCISGPNQSPQLSKVLEDLKSRPGVTGKTAWQDLNNVMGHAFKSPYIGNTLDQLEALKKRNLLQPLFDILDISAQSPYRIPYRLDPILKEASYHPKANQSLLYLGKILSSPDLKETIRTSIRVFKTKGKRQFRSNNNYRLKVSDPDKIKREVYQHLKELGREGEFHQVYENAREAFETHNEKWFYEDGPYNKLSPTEFKNELTLFLKGMSQGNNLKEFIKALQDVGSSFSLNEFVNQTLDTQEAALHYTRAGEPRIRIVNQLDQLETLIRNGDVSVTYVNHIGTAFQIALVEAWSLRAAMKKQLILVKGAEKYTEYRDQFSAQYVTEGRHYKIKNLVTNFNVLSDMAANGSLAAIQRIYAALYKATPPKYRSVDDPTKNHMSLINRLNNVGIFAQLSMVLGSAREQGQLNNILSGAFGLIHKISDNDVEYLKWLLDFITTPRKPGEPPPVDYFLDKFLEVNQDPEKLRNMKDTLYHLLPAIESLELPVSAVIRSLPYLVAYPETWKDLVDFIFDDGVKDEGVILSFAATVSDKRLVRTESMAKVRALLDMMVSDERGKAGAYLPDTVELLAQTYSREHGRIIQMIENLKALKQDQRLSHIDFSNLTSDLIESIHDIDGLGNGLGSLLEDPLTRRQLINIVQVLSSHQDIDKLMHVLIRAIRSGQLASSLDFVFDNLKPKYVN